VPGPIFGQITERMIEFQLENPTAGEEEVKQWLLEFVTTVK
jgi:hypothetical protein